MVQYENGLPKESFVNGHNNQSICVIFEAPHLAEPGLMAGVRCQMAGVRLNFGKSRVLKKLPIAQTIQLFALFYRGVLSLQLH